MLDFVKHLRDVEEHRRTYFFYIRNLILLKCHNLKVYHFRKTKTLQEINVTLRLDFYLEMHINNTSVMPPILE